MTKYSFSSADADACRALVQLLVGVEQKHSQEAISRYVKSAREKLSDTNCMLSMHEYRATNGRL
jgi:hypothetical protein